ncbi:BREX-2 system phosphatase PglZ [Nocardia sp. NPDC050710]|uniref:BREX-2 system phosphatase PglZ n=1 Tax=Nocardia sp. NPDC050710 TaxID=3157220 RepID=UPI0033F0426E
MTATSPPASATRLSKAVVAQFLSVHSSASACEDRVVVLLRGAPVWEDSDELPIGSCRVRVVAAPSVLAVHEQVLDHLSKDSTDTGPRVLVVLTDREHDELDPAILARTFRQRINQVDRWEVVRQAFGATEIDEWLKRETWAAEPLLDAAGADSWPRVTGGVLSQDEALVALAVRRLRLTEVDPGASRLDPEVLLRWSHTPGGPELLRALREQERIGLRQFLGRNGQAGSAGKVLLDLVLAGNGADAVAYGLVCAALWLHPNPDHSVYQARGRAERRIGDHPPVTGEELDRRMTVFGRVCADYIANLIDRANDPRARKENTPLSVAALNARAVAYPALDRAAALAREFGADTAIQTSSVMKAGLEARFTAVGHALGRGDLPAAERALDELRAHHLAADDEYSVRIDRIEMARRLTRWLAGDPDPTADTVADALQRHLAETGWVDRALDFVEAGGDTDPALKIPYKALIERVRERRREFDREFALSLRGWTEAGTDPGWMLTVETFLSRVVAPIAGQRRVLLIVLDGMSAAIATAIADQLRIGWTEYDPVPDGRPERRRAMAAALPSWTAVSRTSLFAGRLMQGDQNDERRLFPQHRFWGGAKTAAVFHKNDLRPEPGHPFGAELTAALDQPNMHVAVVLNTIDDRLGKELKLGDPQWQLYEIGDLRALLRAAADHDMSVLLTSDHGHVIDRHGVRIDDHGTAKSARHRLADPQRDEVGETEIVLSGPRVVAPEPNASIIALWDNDSRYTTQKAGYHGGASLAEVTIPVLAFLPLGAEPPKGWRELGPQDPRWWNPDDAEPAAVATTAGEIPVRTRQVARAAKERHDGTAPMFDLPVTASAPPLFGTSDSDDMVTRLLASETFQAQRMLLARPPQEQKLEKAIRALIETPLSATALAQRIGERPIRAEGFAAILRQLLNFDGVEVLRTDADGRTLKLSVRQLRAQFELT